MIKKIGVLTLIIATSSIALFGATVLSDDYIIKIDNQGRVPSDVNLIGVDAHTINYTTTGETCKNASVTTIVSTTTANPCMLYGVLFSTSYATGQYVTVRDDYDPTSTATPIADIQCSTTVNANYLVVLPQPIKFTKGIAATNSASTFRSTLLFRYLKR